MSTKEIGSSTNTESVPRGERVIEGVQNRILSFDYKEFCREVMKKTKRSVDACFLVPLKWYHSNQKNVSGEIIQQVETVMDKFLELPNALCEYFWLWLDSEMQNNKRFLDGNWEEDINDTAFGIIENTKSQMGDVSKLVGSRYIRILCENRDEIECQILNVYEITLKRIYSTDKMGSLLHDIVLYLKECKIGIKETTEFVLNQREEYIYKKAANIMLLIIRLYLGIDSKLALRWYREGNIEYFYEDNIMLEDYILVIRNYPYQSYECFTKMEKMAEIGKNKYAAKEVGDIYRLGITLVNYYGNRILIKKDNEKACEFYGICIEKEYIPAYISAVRTGALINEQQKNELLQQAEKNGDFEGLVYDAERCIKKADECCQVNLKEALDILFNAAETIDLLEDAYAAKYVLKNELLLSKTFEVIRNSKEIKNEELFKALKKLYSLDILKLNKTDIYKIIEETYIEAEKWGYYEAEYRLGKFFQDIEPEKSENYFEQGKEKGCNWCRLEVARRLKKQNVKKWLDIMIEIGRDIQENEKLKECMIKELAESKEVWEVIEKEKMKIEYDKIAKIYLLFCDGCIYTDKRKSEILDEIEEKNALLAKLINGKKKMEQWMSGINKDKGK